MEDLDNFLHPFTSYYAFFYLQDLPLAYRVKAMEGLRDCSLAPLRVFYQVCASICCFVVVIFMLFDFVGTNERRVSSNFCSPYFLLLFVQTFKRVVGNLFYSYISEHGKNSKVPICCLNLSIKYSCQRS